MQDDQLRCQRLDDVNYYERRCGPFHHLVDEPIVSLGDRVPWALLSIQAVKLIPFHDTPERPYRAGPENLVFHDRYSADTLA